MQFSLTSLFVVPVGNTLPTSGSTENLTDNQVGIFKDEARTPATAGNASTANFVQVFKGNPSLNLPSTGSSKIKSTKVKEWYKITGSNGSVTTQATTTTGVTSGSASITLGASNSAIEVGQVVTGTGIPNGTVVIAISGTSLTISQNATASASGTAVTLTFLGVEIYEVSNFTNKCDQDVTLSLRGHSQYLDTISFNGFTRSVTVKTPCCDCGANPCDTVDAELVVDALLTKIASDASAQLGVTKTIAQLNAMASADFNNKLTLSNFFIFTKVGTGASTKIYISSKPLTVYGKFCDVALNSYEFDRIWFNVWVYEGPVTSQDFMVYNACSPAASVALTQKSSFPQNTSTEVEQMEINYYSYNSPYKHLFRMSGYNQYFTSAVTPGTIYDLYYIKFDDLENGYAWTQTIPNDSTAIIAVPTGSQSTAINNILAAYLGTPTNATGTTTAPSVLYP